MTNRHQTREELRSMSRQNIRELQALMASYEMGSISGAAKLLGVSQPDVSKRLASLASKTSEPLYQSRPFRLLPAGRRLVELGHRMLAARRALDDELKGKRARPAMLRIGIIESVLHDALGSFLTPLRSEFEGLALELTVESTDRLVERMGAGTLDLAVAAAPASGKDVQTRSFGSMPMVFVGSRRHHTKAKYSLAELAELGIIAFQAGSSPFRAISRLIRMEGLETTRVHAVSSISAMTDLVADGWGVATLPEVVAKRLETQGSSWRRVECDAALPPLPIYASYRIDPSESQQEQIIERALGLFALKKTKPTSARKRARKEPPADAAEHERNK